MGEAAQLKEFQRQGLGLRTYPALVYAPEDPAADESGTVNVTHSTPTFQGQESWPAVKDFFDLTTETAHYLFMNESYNIDAGSAKHVAARIRQFIASGGAAP